MKRLRYLIFAILVFILSLSLSSCDISEYLGMLGIELDLGGALSGEHECIYTSWQETQAPGCTSKGKEERTCIICTESEEREISPTGHTPIIDAAEAASCDRTGLTEGSHCDVCGETIVAQRVVEKTEHREEIIPATDSKTAGKRCSACGEVLEKPEWIFTSEYESPDSYDGDYAYNYLQNMSNGAALVEFYDRIDELADAYHLGDISAELDSDDYVIGEVSYSDLGISIDEALTVWTSYTYDHPLYYWLSKSVKYVNSAENGRIYLISYPEYADTDTRLLYNQLLYDKVKEYVESIASEDSVYEITLALHDMIIDSSSYAYESDGRTPSSLVWAHNVVGIMIMGSGVCESYAKSFELILNYVGVDNVYVTGISRGESHAWNLVELSEGNWYWYDLTWDDTPNWLLGTSYNYFCVNDTDNTNWYDAQASFDFETVTFVENHTVTPPDVLGMNYLYDLPERAESTYDSSSLILRDTFTVDGLTYALIGSGEVQLIGIDKEGEIIIPESVLYLGDRYTVTAIGRMDEGGYFFESDRITESAITSVTVPGTVEYVYYGAFNSSTLTYIGVDEENSYYASLDGVLYTKDFSEIEWLPRKISGEVEIHSAAENFESFYFNSQTLTSVTLHDNVTAIGNNAFYYCTSLMAVYFDGTVSEWNSLPKGTDWSVGASFTVYCKDGTVKVN